MHPRAAAIVLAGILGLGAMSWQQPADKARKVEEALLSKEESSFANRAKMLLQSEAFGDLEKMEINNECAGHFIARHWALFESDSTWEKLVKWADQGGVADLVGNLGLEKSENLLEIKAAFALLDTFEPKAILGPGGKQKLNSERRPEKQSAIRISAMLRKLGTRGLPANAKDFVKAHPVLFDEALASGKFTEPDSNAAYNEALQKLRERERAKIAKAKADKERAEKKRP